MIKIEKEKAKRLFEESPEWFQNELIEAFGKECFVKKNFKDIKTFEDACTELGIVPGDVFKKTDLPDEVAYKKLKIVIKAINQGWIPNWKNTNEYKWWPYFNLSSGFGFQDSNYGYVLAGTVVGSRLCFESEEKSDYAAKQFIDLYKEFLT
jgi:hypothetical protein